MVSEPLLDFAALFTPIPGDAPAGGDLRADLSATAPFRVMRDQREAARKAERRTEEGEPTSSAAFWDKLLDAVPPLLETQSKDLELACWLLDVLVRRFGFVGLRDGLTVIEGLVRDFWNGLHPNGDSDEDPVEARTIPLRGVLQGTNSPLIVALRQEPLTGDGPPGPFTAYQYGQAAELEALTDEEKRADRLKRGFPTMEQVQEAFARTPSDQLRNSRDDISAALDVLGRLDGLLTERCGRNAPSVSSLEEALHGIRSIIDTAGAAGLAATAPAAAAAATMAPGQATEAAASPTPAEEARARPVVAPVGPIADREQALRLLGQVAAFFRQTEPQSLITMMLENVARRGRLSPRELIGELVPDDESRKTFYIRAGIQIPDEN